MHPALRAFFFPNVTRWYLLRLALVAVGALLFFHFVCVPFRIHGRSMEPTYHDGGFNFCWCPRYWRHPPQRGDVVMVRLSGQSVLFMKRVVALEGETVEFRNGVLAVDGEAVHEPYLVNPYPWNLPPRVVKQGYVYLVGDNRSMPMENHDFGQTPRSRILGGPLW